MKNENRSPFFLEGLIFCLNYSTVPPLLKVTKGTQKESRITFQSHHSFQGSFLIFNFRGSNMATLYMAPKSSSKLRKAGGLGVHPCFFCFPLPCLGEKGDNSTIQLENREKSTAILSPPSNPSHRRTAT